MATFPLLKTGAVAQYGSERRKHFSTQVFRFVDGSEQRFPGFGAELRKWVVRLNLLDESELINLQSFFQSEGGRAGTFSFTDPFDGVVYPKCRFEADEVDAVFGGIARGAAVVTISEVRG